MGQLDTPERGTRVAEWPFVLCFAGMSCSLAFLCLVGVAGSTWCLAFLLLLLLQLLFTTPAFLLGLHFTLAWSSTPHLCTCWLTICSKVFLNKVGTLSDLTPCPTGLFSLTLTPSNLTKHINALINTSTKHINVKQRKKKKHSLIAPVFHLAILTSVSPLCYNSSRQNDFKHHKIFSPLPALIINIPLSVFEKYYHCMGRILLEEKLQYIVESFNSQADTWSKTF